MKNEIILFENQDVKLEVNLKEETVWLTQNQMAQLFGRDVKTISKHIIKSFDEELEEKSNSQKTRIANSDKPVNLYNLDVIISVGYRVKSQTGIIFRKWATNISYGITSVTSLPVAPDVIEVASKSWTKEGIIKMHFSN